MVVPEFIVRKWWQGLLHTQTAFFIKTALLFEPDVVVIDVPYRIGVRKKIKKKKKSPPQEVVEVGASR